MTSSSSGSSSGRGARALRVGLLIDGHFDFVWRSARRLGLSYAEADDAAREVFVAATRRLDEVDPLRERAFLFGTLLRSVAARRNNIVRRRDEPALELEADALETTSRRELSRVRPLLQDALETLSESQRVVFVLYEIEELELSEIAELLELPSDTVVSRLRAARSSFEAAAQRLRIGASSSTPSVTHKVEH